MGRLSATRVLISAGPTREMLDPVRYLSNRSTGALGYALARCAQARGARVTLVSGPVAEEVGAQAMVRGVRIYQVLSAREMFRACLRHARTADIIIMAAAVADYRPLRMRRHKIKKGGAARLTLTLVRNPDILATLCQRRRPGQYIVGFALESRQLLRHARAKLRQKGCDLIIANATTSPGAPRHRATMIDRNGKAHPLPALPKSQLARRLWDHIEGHL